MMRVDTTVWRNRRVLLLAALLVLALVATIPPRTTKALTYTLVFQDEFNWGNFSRPDGSKWRVTEKVSTVNEEKQYYRAANAFHWGGSLVLKSVRENYGGRLYTSGRVDTKGKFEFQYGEVEIRAQIINAGGPNITGTAPGVWPAIWLVNAACEAAQPCATNEWPPEIDIGEWKGESPSKIYMTQHFGVYPNNGYNGTTWWGPDFSQGFHTYKLLWDPNQIVWYVDGVQHHRVTTNIPSKKMQIVLNVAVGGNFDGLQDPGGTAFPRETKIDYVRVYRWQ
jgi:beta-glucanase (GH16 family)